VRDTPYLGQQLRISQDLLLEFFATFARFEYALKEGGFARQARHGGGVEPDWERFGRSIGGDVDEIMTAGSYLLSQPPKKQTLTHNTLTWTEVSGDGGLAELLGSVRRVRNNLFHGGKFADGSVSNPERNTQLLNGVLDVVHALLRHPDVRVVADRFYSYE